MEQHRPEVVGYDPKMNVHLLKTEISDWLNPTHNLSSIKG